VAACKISVNDVLKEFVSNENSSTDDDELYDEVIEYMKRKVNYQKGEDVLSCWKKTFFYVSTIITFSIGIAFHSCIISNK